MMCCFIFCWDGDHAVDNSLKGLMMNLTSFD